MTHTPPSIPSLPSVPQTIPMATMVLDATAHHTTHYCRLCGKPYQPHAGKMHTAQFFRCAQCTDTKVLARALVNSCVLM